MALRKAEEGNERSRKMIYHLLYPLHDKFSYFNVFRYITFRTIYATVTALLICFVVGPWLIKKLQSLQIGQPIRNDGPDTHLAKKGTPTMGGILIIFSIVISTLLWANLTVDYVWLVIMVIVGYGLIGFMDDYKKLTHQDSRGIPGKVRLAGEIAIALFVSTILYLKPGFTSSVTIPFFKTALPDLGWGYVVFSTFVIVGAANAVNLTDGLDGLAIGPAITCFMTYLLFAYFAGNVRIAGYLQIPYVGGPCHSVRRHRGRRPWLSLVQFLPRPGIHGRRGLVSLGRHPRHARDTYKTGDSSCHSGRNICARDLFRHLSGWLVQGVQREAHLQNGAASPSLRAQGLGGTESHRPLLDNFHSSGTGGDKHPEIEMRQIL